MVCFISYTVVYFKSFISADEAYYVAAMSYDCPLKLVIKNENECIRAATKLGLSYFRIIGITEYERPAGCYTYKDHDNKATYFNTVIEISSTTPSADTAGVCRSGTIV